MNGPDHYREAERTMALARLATAQQANSTEPSDVVTMMLTAAQVHATLALAAATALNDAVNDSGDGGMPADDLKAWKAAAGVPKDGAS